VLDKITFTGVYDYSLQSLSAQSPGISPPRKDEKYSQSQSEAATTLLVRELFGPGIDLYKQKSEQISDFAFDNTSTSDNIVIGLMNSGSREIPIVNTLRLRMRYENGLQLTDEENLTWEECLHRYDELEQIMYGSSPQRAT